MTDTQRINAIKKYQMRIYRFSYGPWCVSAMGIQVSDPNLRRAIMRLVKELGGDAK